VPLIIYNPKSRNGHPQKKMKSFLKKTFKDGETPRIIDVTKEPDLPGILATWPVDDPVYLLGGDGTINHFVNQVFDQLPLPFPIILIPLGSGNDFSRTLKRTPTDTQPVYKMTTQDGPKYFVNGMGVGIDGVIGERVNQALKKTRLTYFIQTIKGLLTYTPQTVTVTTDTLTRSFDKTYLVVASSGQYFGSGMRISPNATWDDPGLDIIIVHAISRIKLLAIFLSIYVGGHLRFKKHVFHTQSQSLKIKLSQSSVAQTDGETWPNQTVVSVTMTEKKTAFRLAR